MTTPRPDQAHIFGGSGAGGSRSGSGDMAASLGYPGVPPAVINCKTFSALKRSEVGSPHTLGQFTAPGRIWTVVLSYAVRAQTGFAGGPGGTAAFFAAIETTLSGLSLATVNLGITTAGPIANGQSEPPIPGIPVVQGETIVLDVNSGASVTNALQFAGAIVYYSIP